MKKNDLKKIKKRDTYLFAANDEKYGLIQVIKKSRSGFLVRVFYELIEENKEEKIGAMINGSDFYFIDNFMDFTLEESCKYVGKYDIPKSIVPPRLTRACERRVDGKIYWYVFDRKRKKLVKELDKVDDELKALSPDSSWGIEYIKRRWKEGFTLEKWHELAELWYRKTMLKTKTSSKGAKEKNHNEICEIISAKLFPYVNEDGVSFHPSAYEYKFIISLGSYMIEISYIYMDGFFKIKIEDRKHNRLNDVIFPTKSKRFKREVATRVKKYGDSVKSFSANVGAFCEIFLENYETDEGLATFRKSYIPDLKFDGIFI